MPLQGNATMGWHVHLPTNSDVDVTARTDECLGYCSRRSGKQDHSLTTQSLQNGQNIRPWARGLGPRRGLRRVGAANRPPHQYHQHLHQHHHQNQNLLNRYRGHTHACFCFHLRPPAAALRRLSRRGPSTCCLNKGSPAWCRNALAECFETIDGRQAQNSRCAKTLIRLALLAYCRVER